MKIRAVQTISRKARRARSSRLLPFLAGLVEGEGSVHVSIKRHPALRLGYYFQPEFFIYQHRVQARAPRVGSWSSSGARPDPPQTRAIPTYSVLLHPLQGRRSRERVLPFSPVPTHALLRE